MTLFNVATHIRRYVFFPALRASFSLCVNILVCEVHVPAVISMFINSYILNILYIEHMLELWYTMLLIWRSCLKCQLAAYLWLGHAVPIILFHKVPPLTYMFTYRNSYELPTGSSPESLLKNAKVILRWFSFSLSLKQFLALSTEILLKMDHSWRKKNNCIYSSIYKNQQ